MKSLSDFLTSPDYKSLEDANLAFLLSGTPSEISKMAMKANTFNFPNVTIGDNTIKVGENKLPDLLTGNIPVWGPTIPTTTLPEIPQWGPKVPSLPSVPAGATISLPTVNTGLNIPGYDIGQLKTAFPTVDLSKAWNEYKQYLPSLGSIKFDDALTLKGAFGDWGEVANKYSQGFKVEGGKVNYNPTLGQIADTVNAVGGVLSKAPGYILKNIGGALQTGAGVANNILSGINSALSAVNIPVVSMISNIVNSFNDHWSMHSPLTRIDKQATDMYSQIMNYKGTSTAPVKISNSVASLISNYGKTGDIASQWEINPTQLADRYVLPVMSGYLSTLTTDKAKSYLAGLGEDFYKGLRNAGKEDIADQLETFAGIKKDNVGQLIAAAIAAQGGA